MILRTVKERALRMLDVDGELELVDFSFALPYTWVLVRGSRGRSLGVAMTLPEEVQTYGNSIEEPTVESFVERLDSLNVIERTLGLAAVNAISQYYFDPGDAEWRDAVELITEAEPEKVAVVGNMPPVVRAIRDAGIEAYVFERNSKLWDRSTLSDALEYWLLPEVDAVIASATCLVNGTLDLIVDRARRAKLIVLTGPTGQLHPDLLKGSGVTHVAGMKVVDVDGAIRELKLGRFKGFERFSRKYTLRIPAEENG
ncbi:MAG: hypothetical protein GXO14_06555 [Thermococci archaeon]|nr:hypothetical protein [Thermococci archaeon]